MNNHFLNEEERNYDNDGLDSSDDEEESIQIVVPEPLKQPVNSKSRSWYAMADESDSEDEE